MKNLTKTLNAFIVVLLGVLSFGSVALADSFGTTTLITSGNFTVPAGVSNLNVSITGGGGGGGGGAFTYGGGGGGAGSSISNVSMSVTPGQVIPFIIGTGGNGGSTGNLFSSGGVGSNGASSFFGGGLIFANGGNGGKGAIDGGSGGQGGISGGAGGTNGTNGDAFFGERHAGGNGGTTPLGAGGNGGWGSNTSYTLPVAGTNGNGGGGGSGWAYYSDVVNRDAGAKGGDGIIVVSYVVDTTAPVITVLGSNPVTVVAGTAYTDAGATALDNINGNLTGMISTTNPITLSTPVGVYTISYSVSDLAGNTTTATRTVNVVATADLTSPVITILGSNPVNIMVGAAYTDAGATATDNVDGDITSNIITTGLPITTNIIGTYSVAYSVTDGAGNNTSSSRTINVIAIPVDLVAPVITLINGTPVTITVGSTYVDSGATALDNVDGDVTANITTSTDLNASVVGVYLFTYTVSDAAGNVATAARTINVVPVPADNVPPAITITGGTPTTFYASSTYVYVDQGATAYDIFDDATTTATVTFSSVNASVIGIYSVLYSATDIAGNTANATRIVNVVAEIPGDNIPPVITLINGTPTTITVGSTYIDSGATAVDNIDGDVTALIATSTNLNTAVIGSYLYTYTVSDAAGNISSASRTVIVIAAPADNAAPVITITGGTPITVLSSSTAAYADLGATSYDVYDNATTTLVGVSNVDLNIIGIYSVVYSATDIAGNLSAATRTVNVIAADVIAPVISILGANPMNIIKTIPYVELGSIVIDNFDGTITAVITGSVNVNATGTYLIVYTATDSSGNVSSSTRIVNVIDDNIAPVITITGSNPASLTVGGTYTDAGATALDNIDGVVAVSTISNNVNTAVVGVYTVVYSATDVAGNIATLSRTVNVNVLDTIAPVITILGSNPVTVLLNSVYSDSGATALDAADGNMTGGITTTNLVNTSLAGAYTVTYVVADTKGNTATSTRIVNVVATPDITLPNITILGLNPDSIVVGQTYTDAGATSTDNVDGDITSHITTINTINNLVIGSYFIKYTVIDGAGNTASTTRTVNVIADNIAPAISITGANPASVLVEQTYTDAGATAVDNVDGAVAVSTISNNVNTAVIGSYLVVYSATDVAGNTATSSRTVNVVATIPSGGGGHRYRPLVDGGTTIIPLDTTASSTATSTAIDTASSTILNAKATTTESELALEAKKSASEINVNEIKPNAIPDTGLQIPRGVGKLDPIFNDVENNFTSASDVSNATTSDTNGLVATVFDAFANIPNKVALALILLAFVAIIDSMFLGGLSAFTSKKL